jgi:DNA-nicking Smr family endonuclease
MKRPPATLRELIGPVKPLAPGPTRVSPAKTKRATARAPSPPAWSGGSAASFAIDDDGTRLEGARSGQEKVMRELARGQWPATATLDLHGMTAAQAERALVDFCIHQRSARRHAVLVVHGRGIHSPGNRGVLREEIAAWLSSGPLSHMVLCFATARPRDGGGGALYVLLASEGRGPK